MKCTVSISFEPQLMAAVNEYCAGKGCSRSWLVNKALTEYFPSLEDQEDYETAVTVLDELEKSGFKFSMSYSFSNSSRISSDV